MLESAVYALCDAGLSTEVVGCLMRNVKLERTDRCVEALKEQGRESLEGVASMVLGSPTLAVSGHP